MNAKPTINAPTVTLEHSDYLLQCEFSLEPSVRKLIQLATASGWANDVVALSVARIAAQRWQETLHHQREAARAVQHSAEILRSRPN